MQGTVLYKSVQHISEQGLKDCILQKRKYVSYGLQSFFQLVSLALNN